MPVCAKAKDFSIFNSFFYEFIVQKCRGKEEVSKIQNIQNLFIHKRNLQSLSEVCKIYGIQAML